MFLAFPEFLGLDKVSIGACTSEKFVVASTLQDEAVTHNVDNVGILDGRETMGDSDRCTA
jgi:hypothetical protein